MTRKPRRDVIVRRFLAGESIAKILCDYYATLNQADIENAIRWAFERRRK